MAWGMCGRVNPSVRNRQKAATRGGGQGHTMSPKDLLIVSRSLKRARPPGNQAPLTQHSVEALMVKFSTWRNLESREKSW